MSPGPPGAATQGESTYGPRRSLPRRPQRLGIAAETVALIVANQIADQGAKQLSPRRVVRRVGLDEISLKKLHKLYATILTDLTDPGHPEVLAVAAGRDRAATEPCLRKLSQEQRQAVATHAPT